MPQNSDEIFAVYDDRNQPVGSATRSDVHRRGLYHRSVHVLLFDTSTRATARLLLQRRAAGKDVLPGHWDLSCGEHLQPGESFEAAARRGLREELGIGDLGALQRLRPARLQHHRDAELGIDDREFVELWCGVYNGPLTPNEEVAALRWVAWSSLLSELRDSTETYTPWLRDEVAFVAGQAGVL